MVNIILTIQWIAAGSKLPAQLLNYLVVSDRKQDAFLLRLMTKLLTSFAKTNQIPWTLSN